MEARRAHNPKVVGSNPTAATTPLTKFPDDAMLWGVPLGMGDIQGGTDDPQAIPCRGHGGARVARDPACSDRRREYEERPRDLRQRGDIPERCDLSDLGAVLGRRKRAIDQFRTVCAADPALGRKLVGQRELAGTCRVVRRSAGDHVRQCLGVLGSWWREHGGRHFERLHRTVGRSRMDPGHSICGRSRLQA